MTNEAYKDELNAAAERKQGQSRLVYDKTKRTIVTEGLHAPDSAESYTKAPALATMQEEKARYKAAMERESQRAMDAALSPSPLQAGLAAGKEPCGICGAAYGHSPACTHNLKHAENNLHAMLDERGSRYGKFVDHAACTQELKASIYRRLKDKKLMPDQLEALEMIAHKIGRIVCGDPDFEDSWRDIAGYATLVADRLKGEER